MAAEVITTNKIIKLLGNYDFLKIRLLRGSDAVYLDQVRPGETAADLQNRFQDWISDFIDDDNFKEYKLELYGNADSDPAAKKTLFLKTTIQFNATPGQLVKPGAPQVVGSTHDGFTAKEYIELAREKAILEAKCETLESKYLDLEDEIQELREVVETSGDQEQPKTMGEVMNAALMQNADKIIGVLVDKLMGNSNNFALAGLDTAAPVDTKYQIFDAMCEIEPGFPDHLNMLYQLRKNDPMIYNIALAKLKNL